MSNHLIPEDFKFSASEEPAFVSTDEAVRVQAGAEVRLRIVGARMDATEIVRSYLLGKLNRQILDEFPDFFIMLGTAVCWCFLPLYLHFDGIVTRSPGKASVQLYFLASCVKTTCLASFGLKCAMASKV